VTTTPAPVSHGETKVLVGAIVGEDADNLIGYLVIGVTRDGSPVIAHNLPSAWQVAGALGEVIASLAKSEDPR
jgi:hypothetical protein